MIGELKKERKKVRKQVTRSSGLQQVDLKMARGEGRLELRLRVILTLLAVMVANNVEESAQLKAIHPLHSVVDRINHNGGPYIALLMTFPTEELVLIASGLFVPCSHLPWVDLSGRRFNIGRIKGVDVIYVMSGEQTLNAGITVQILVDVFDIKGIVHYGIAGSADDSLLVGDVSVPKCVAFTGSWNWKEFESSSVEKGKGRLLPELKFGAYDVPENGENLLAEIEFSPQQLYHSSSATTRGSNGQEGSQAMAMEEVFWLPVEPKWFTLASQQLQDLKLLQCINETYCLPEPPKVVYGLRASTADIYLNNAAYRNFLFDQFNVSTVDEESSAVVMTCLTNGVPCIVFRGVSDMAGAERKKLSSAAAAAVGGSLTSLAAANALTVAVEFIGLIGSLTSSNPIDHDLSTLPHKLKLQK